MAPQLGTDVPHLHTYWLDTISWIESSYRRTSRLHGCVFIAQLYFRMVLIHVIVQAVKRIYPSCNWLEACMSFSRRSNIRNLFPGDLKANLNKDFLSAHFVERPYKCKYPPVPGRTSVTLVWRLSFTKPPASTQVRSIPATHKTGEDSYTAARERCENHAQHNTRSDSPLPTPREISDATKPSGKAARSPASAHSEPSHANCGSTNQSFQRLQQHPRSMPDHGPIFQYMSFIALGVSLLSALD
mmetsp:Transcript_21507/g.32022  ORF Transcript_21507/g.32022 Transcript_21507/m.32022 type:complete len:243 (-) Transcript_21507:1884-2612(-)